MLFNICAIVACALIACIFIYLRIADGGVAAIVSKTLASFVFVIAGLFAFVRSGLTFETLVFIPIGLICGMIGDILLELKVVYPIDKKPYFYAGTTSFALGHIFYAIALCVIASSMFDIFTPVMLSISIGLTVATLIMLFADGMEIKFGEYFWISYLYAFILATMVSLAVFFSFYNIMFVYFAVGMALFFISDLILSLQYFGPASKEHSPALVILNHVFYYAAQIMVVAFLIFA